MEEHPTIGSGVDSPGHHRGAHHPTDSATFPYHQYPTTELKIKYRKYVIPLFARVKPLWVSHVVWCHYQWANSAKFACCGFGDSCASKKCFYSSGLMMWSVECGISVKALLAMLTKLNLHFMSHDMLRE